VGSMRFEVGEAIRRLPHIVVTRRHKSRLLNFALHAPEDDYHAIVRGGAGGSPVRSWRESARRAPG
jgi:hypothetical protein